MYDALIVGAGPGGYVAAIKLAQHGKRVAVVEKSFVGGTCTNWGCIPTKALLTSAHLLRSIVEKGEALGVQAENVSFDFSKIRGHMNKVVMASRKGIEYLFKKNGVELIAGEAIVESANCVRVQDRRIEASCLVIATGSVPTLFPPFSEVPGIWTSDDVFRMERLPESVLIVGGGVIGVELATFFSSLNVKVIVVELLEHILPNEDADAAQIVAKTLKKRGVEIYESSKLTSVQPVEKGYRSIIETREGQIEKTTEKVIVAVGRKPKITDDLKAIGLAIERGIRTDETMLTNVPNVYAVGDVRGQIMLAHVAMYEAVVAAENICGKSVRMDYSAVPSVIFSEPEVASVGVREKDVDPSTVKIFSYPLMANGRARTMLEKDGFAKFIADAKTGKILGATIVGPYATELIMEATIAVRNGLTAEQLERTIHPHPTLSETLLGAVEGIVDKPIHL
ncbi:MAG: Dihydrolipoamide dehydrogenase [Thermotoga sp. 50_1627]|uniref:dihydrolipoyl dehydrogenase n=1 Tax=Pseudothermotoga sp. TaxID=2033661 RepID=UPI00076C3783|nr:MAG: Dihydrolipoamide dehydrogenase [Thermotoga sp. 50_64]KUK25736.1 MAG: Dihydrolipoamide dehydrogenase [Thermotoga sp. 50_1627]MBC7115420.1 dihydrolipoyl dehydrogenase [Pseudothermotoga sp.]HBT40162.1 dihydrolipoyl dehydrogenase [Pseudothermotoga sp.]HCO98805.1 dihydrolipoyl dehydrogenase [Pseudothermotoga sp.]